MPELPDVSSASEKHLADLRRKRKRVVRQALAAGTTVPYDLRTLIEDRHSTATIRKVLRHDG